MQGATKERWRELCKLATEEQNLDKLIMLVEEINRILDEKKERLSTSTTELPKADQSNLRPAQH